jgi:hypothetical protein
MDSKVVKPLTRAQLRMRIERDLTELNGMMFVDSGVIYSVEAFDLKKFGKDTVKFGKLLYQVSKDLYALSVNVKDFVLNKIVSEKVIHDKANMLLAAIHNKQGHRAYVAKVPFFQEQRGRFLSLIKVVELIEDTAKRDVSNLPDMDRFIEEIAQTSGGVLKAVPPSKGSTFKNLKWSPPTLESYEISQSPWAQKANIDQIKSLAITCKYDMVEKLKAASLIIAKRCNDARKEIASVASTYDNEEDEYASNQHSNEIANMYTLAYTVKKAIDQTLTQGLQKEINIFTNTYLTRLQKLKYE